MPRGVSNAFTRPYGGGNFVYAFRSADSSVGFAGWAINLANFNPIASGKGASLSCAIKKYDSNKVTYAPMFGLVNSLNPSTGNGYLLGLTEGTSYYYACKKGNPAGGLSASASNILRKSRDAYTNVGDGMAAWHHLKMDVIVNPHNEVHLKFYKNALQVAHAAGVGGPVDDPEWLAIPGMEDFIDDSAGVLTLSLPYTGSFFAIFGHYCSNVPGASSLFDHFVCARQLTP